MRNFLRRLLRAEKPQAAPAERAYGPRELDQATGVANRSAFEKMVEESLAGGRVQGCLILVDVDRMKEVNETYGAQTGDRALRAVADVLRESFRCVDGIGRLEEDTFGVWAEGICADQVGGIRRRIAVVNDKLLHRDGTLPAVTLSAGVALGEAGESYQELYRQATKVLQRVKEGGRCGCEISE